LTIYNRFFPSINDFYQFFIFLLAPPTPTLKNIETLRKTVFFIVEKIFFIFFKKKRKNACVYFLDMV